MKKKQLKKVRAIIYDIKNNKPYFLILHRVLRWEGWEFVKETIKQGESCEKALERGIREETKLSSFEVIKKLNKQEEWQALGNYYKVVETYLVRADIKQEISLKQELIEHDRYQWADKKSALEKLTWPESKELLKEINL